MCVCEEGGLVCVWVGGRNVAKTRIEKSIQTLSWCLIIWEGGGRVDELSPSARQQERGNNSRAKGGSSQLGAIEAPRCSFSCLDSVCVFVCVCVCLCVSPGCEARD